MSDFDEAREWMVERQIAQRGVRDARVLAAMRHVPRDAFVPADVREFAYDDTPLPIGGEQSISQPFIVGKMLEAAQLQPGDRVLDIGTGSGYAAAIAAEIVARVDSIERDAALAETARECLQRLGYANVEVHIGDGTVGLAAHAPYDAIIAAAGGPYVPQALRAQLAPGGRLVMPVGGSPSRQRLVKVVRRGENDYDEETFGDVRFVPLVGSDGWPDLSEVGRCSHAEARAATTGIEAHCAASEATTPIGAADATEVDVGRSSAEMAEGAKAIKTAGDIGAAEASESTESNASNASNRAAETAKTAETTEPTDATDATDATEPTEPPAPPEPAEPAEPREQPQKQAPAAPGGGGARG
ncbi:protein-L-isoaspartate(D-aspartate) O-methyltransferase, partial [Burkholderia sp. SRS-W-2-2016]|uniref:protein-L-isoaspartate(D-aspartate) O-methyltransferase n=1 Tax=Burkholderia sp. SRS-W-2-2016 TaxID=1926878 RepID=UPI000AB68750